MQTIRHLTPGDFDYPARVRALGKVRPSHLSVHGSLKPAFTVAIVGARKARDDAARYAEDLAATLAGMGIVVISGGAHGIDAAAHRGAIDAGGRTWAVAGTGSNHVFPANHDGLYDEIVRSGGAMLWPFRPEAPAHSGSFLARNRVLASLADVLVVVQAGLPSGALSAANCARKLSRPVWVVAGSPWASTGFEGGAAFLAASRADPNVLALTSTKLFLNSLGGSTVALSDAQSLRWVTTLAALTGAEKAMAEAVSREPKHADELAAAAGLSAGAAATALLTLALEDVVVEGPGGFYRRTGP